MVEDVLPPSGNHSASHSAHHPFSHLPLPLGAQGPRFGSPPTDIQPSCVHSEVGITHVWHIVALIERCSNVVPRTPQVGSWIAVSTTDCVVGHLVDVF